METVLKLKAFELTTDFVDAFRKFLNNNMDVDIIIKYDKEVDSDFLKPETREEYFARLDKAIDDVENKRNLVTFTWKEFEVLTKQLAKR